MTGESYRKEIVDYLSELYNRYAYAFSPASRDPEVKYPYDDIISYKYGNNFDEFLAKRGITDKYEIADFILAFESNIEKKKYRVEPLLSAFHRAMGYFISKSSVYKLKNNPIDIFY
ncbi:MAG: hypothetical protein N2504_03835 [candidate division WOR-3 bacterium]|nr:hypothetical protein [candidate division WOR-3 bacterium]MCX7947699.1 hypothetical protein [candidate division WOR-3 bacterium]MDW8150576.1 hypothetical protein [candidate division WOR-3 bacterium]